MRCRQRGRRAVLRLSNGDISHLWEVRCTVLEYGAQVNPTLATSILCYLNKTSVTITGNFYQVQKRSRGFLLLARCAPKFTAEARFYA